MPALSSKHLDQFYKAASSLRLYSRADLSDDKNRTLIEKLYVDPLPNEQAFKSLFASNTTILIGRKGTGKSTVFQRVQHEIRKDKSGIVSAYMDIRNVFEASQVDPATIEKIEKIDSALPAEQLQKLLLYKKFTYTLVRDIREELHRQIERSFVARMQGKIKRSSRALFKGLDDLIEKIDASKFENIEAIIEDETREASGEKRSIKKSSKLTLNADPIKLGGSAAASLSDEKSNDYETEEKFKQILMRVVGVSDLIAEIQEILNESGYKYLYIFLDDFSELPMEAMKTLVDTLISPLSRWSDFIKFKIAAYPGRIYLGSIDKTKIDELHLDLYGLYGSSGVTKMEEKALDFVKRIIERRIIHFCKGDIEDYFDPKSREIWRVLFYSSMANPRILGHIMLYAYEANLLYGRRIGVRSVQEASQKYYEDKIATFFTLSKYKLSFLERSSSYSLKELLEQIVSHARSLRQENRGTAKAGEGSYSSHFYLNQELESLLASLELGFFVTKYFEQSDRAGMRVSVFALNYGLCNKYQISFGRPSEKREDRLFFVERRFDYNSILRTYIQENQELKCSSCGAEYEIEMLPAIKLLKMQCPECRSGTCSVRNLSRKYGDVLASVSPNLLLPDTELGILQTLHSEDRVMKAAEIASELDCSGQLIGRRARNLSEKALVVRKQKGAVYRYELTDSARSAYFADRSDESLDLDNAM